MKIIYCIAGVYRPAGMERVLVNKTKALAEMGHEIVIVTTEQKGRPHAFDFHPSIRFIDLEVGYEDNNGSYFMNKVINWPRKHRKHRKSLTNVLMEEKADIVVSMFCGEEVFLPKIKDGSRKVLEYHFSRYKRLQYDRKGLWRLADVLRSRSDIRHVRAFDRFVVLTKEDKGYWGDLDNMVVIPNANTFTFDTPATLDSKTVIAVGRYSYQKGFDMLLEAWKMVCDKVEGWSLMIVGDGELREPLENQAKALGIEGSVTFGKSENDMKSVYLNSSILALPSRYEGLPMVLLESQAAGVPSVCFECKCGPKDIIENGVNGVLVPEGNVEMFADKLVELMENEGLRKDMGAKAYQMSTRFNEETIMNKWKELFESLS